MMLSMRSAASRAIPVTVVVACVLAAACGGKTALEGSEAGSGQTGGSGASSSGAGGGRGTIPAPTAAPTPVPPPTAPAPGRPGAQCPASPPSEGADCGWQYGIPCDYALPRNGDTCAVQCICVGQQGDTVNRWTCFDIGCDEG